jgi:dTDP-4-amino-4,6-dideoxygalactose transaminase
MHLHPVYKINDNSYPLSEEKSKYTVSIPFNEVLTNTNILTIIDIIKNFNNEL